MHVRFRAICKVACSHRHIVRAPLRSWQRRKQQRRSSVVAARRPVAVHRLAARCPAAVHRKRSHTHEFDVTQVFLENYRCGYIYICVEIYIYIYIHIYIHAYNIWCDCAPVRLRAWCTCVCAKPLVFLRADRLRQYWFCQCCMWGDIPDMSFRFGVIR